MKTPTSVGYRSLVAWCAATLLLAACDHSNPASPPITNDERDAALQLARAETAIDTLSRAVALALGDSALRAEVRDDLRDAPTRRHAIHLRSYLRGERGRRLAAVAATRLGTSAANLLAIEARLPELELVVPREWDRATWQGSADIVVSGTLVPAPSAGPSLLYATDGRRLELDLSRPAPFPYMRLRPVQSAFGNDPETRRQLAPHQLRNTISTLRAEFLDRRVGTCDTLATATCLTTVAPRTAAVTASQGSTLPTQMTFAYCTAWVSRDVDKDLDGIRDDCEAALASAFTPALWVSRSDENPTKEPRWAVSRDVNNSTTFRIFYALSYHEDGGDVNFNVESHPGDSEFIVVEVIPNGTTSNWLMDWVFLSAHWNTDVNSSAWVHHSNIFFYQNVLRKNVEVWVARDKHANYRTRSACDDGGFFFQDTCDDMYDLNVPFWADANGNLGTLFQFSNWQAQYAPYPQGTLIRNCETSRFAAFYNELNVECYWTDDTFLGWQTWGGGSGAGAGGYKTSLQAFFI